MKIGILGAGSIGMHLAAQLHMAGLDVTLIARTTEQVERLMAEGLLYVDNEGEKKRFRIPAINEADGNEDFGILMITLKQTHLPSAITTLSKFTASNPAFICFQNGIGHDKFFARHFPHISLFLAVTTEGALRESVNSVRHTGKGTTWIGVANAEQNHKEPSLLQQVVDLFTESKMNVKPEMNIYQRIWKKVLVNACINPLTAIFKVRNGQLIESVSSFSLMEKIYQEGKDVAMHEGIEMEQGGFQDIVAVCRNTYHNKSSMLQDVEAGRITEIEYINGAIKRAAEQHGIAVPCNSMVVEMIQALQEWGKRD